MKLHVFFYHYNKPMSKKAGKPVISLHYKHKCLMVDNIVCNVKTKGQIRKTQPHFVVRGQAANVEIKDGVAYVH